MKITGKFAPLTVLLALLLVFCACGGSPVSAAKGQLYADNAVASSAAAMPAPSAPAMEAGQMDISSENTAFSSDRKIVKRIDMNMETKEFDTALQQIFDIISAKGGYVENQNINGQSMRYKGNYYERSATISARIPVENLDAVSESLGGICNVTSRWEGVEDITDTYFDSDAHLKSLKLQEERLLEILSKAEKLEDVISLESALANVRYEIESLTATLRRMDNQVAYSYLSMTVNEVVEYQSVDSAPRTFGERISDAFARSGNKIADFLEGALFFIIEDLPLLLLWLAILGLVAFIVVKVTGFFTRKTGIKKKKYSSPLMQPPVATNAKSDKPEEEKK